MFLLAELNLSVPVKKCLLVAHAQLPLSTTNSYKASVATRTVGVNLPRHFLLATDN